MIMVRYQGRIESLRLIEEFEDHVMQTAMSLGGSITLFRRSTKQSPGRIVRGVSLHLCPGQEAMSLLLSPEGVLIPQQSADEAAFAPLLHCPWCQVATQCGGVDGHTTLIELLEFMKCSWFPELTVTDETGYWEHRDHRRLRQAFTDSAADVHPRYTSTAGFWPASDIADESLGLIQRLDRLFKIRHNDSNSTETPERLPSRSDFSKMSIEESVLWADYVLRQQQRRSQRMCRIIEECLAVGMTAEDATETAMRREGREVDFPEPDSDPDALDSEFEGFPEPAAELCPTAGDHNSHAILDLPADHGESDANELLQNLLDDGASRLLIAARQLMMEIVPRTCRLSDQSGYIGVLHQGLLELVGGLSHDDNSQESTPPDKFDLSFSIVHLRRAIKGASYVHGALAGLRCQRLLEPEHLSVWADQIAEILRSTKTRLQELWTMAGTNS